MSTLEHTFPTPAPAALLVEIGAGRITVTATETAETVVRLSGPGADEVTVDADGPRISIQGQRRHGLFRDSLSRIEVDVTVPVDSEARLSTGSAEIRSTGRLADVQARSGSGYVDLDACTSVLVRTGSGDVSVRAVSGDASVKTGSGDVDLVQVDGDALVSTGSGDVRARMVAGSTAVKTGSGDLRVGRAGSDVSLATGSGTLEIEQITRGRINLKGASGNARIGIASGTPVWTDIRTISGHVRSDLESLGAPGEGQDHVEVRANTVSGSVELRHV